MTFCECRSLSNLPARLQPPAFKVETNVCKQKLNALKQVPDGCIYARKPTLFERREYKPLILDRVEVESEMCADAAADLRIDSDCTGWVCLRAFQKL